MVGIEEILALEHLEKDIFRGAVHPTALQRTFGGQVAGQSLVSAVSTVDESYHVHSLHGYFLRPGNPKIPTVYLVDRIRDGRSFCTRPGECSSGRQDDLHDVGLVPRRRRRYRAPGPDALRSGAGGLAGRADRSEVG